MNEKYDVDNDFPLFLFKYKDSKYLLDNDWIYFNDDGALLSAVSFIILDNKIVCWLKNWSEHNKYDLVKLINGKLIGNIIQID
jgi:hypothetical protein